MDGIKTMQIQPEKQKNRIPIWSRLRMRMAASYVIVSLVIVLGLVSLISVFAVYTLTRTPLLAYLVLAIADRTTQTYALQAGILAEGPELNPETTFEPGQPTSLGLFEEEAAAQELSILNFEVPFIEPGSSEPQWPAFALLIAPEERVISSSYPDAYPTSMNIAQELNDDVILIRSALSGKPDFAVRESEQGRLVAIARPIWNQDREPIGAVYVQVPAGRPPSTPLLAQVAGIVIPSGLFLLCLMLPVGALFGVLTTRSLVRRVERLASATTQFAAGDYAQRIPIRRKDEIGQLEQQFNTMAEQLVDSFAQRQALAEQSARREERARIDQEMRSAYYIQKSLLPKATPAIPGWQIEPFYQPARQVGGDLYDFLALPDGRIGFVIGDANGKGMPSALIMATTSAMLRAAAGTDSPGQVLTQVNDLLHKNIPPATFATCFYAILDLQLGQVNFANAGHNLPYLAHAGVVSELRAVGMPLGLMPEQEYAEQQATIAVGDCIVFYSDGLVEAHNKYGEMFGTPRLMNLVQKHANAKDLIGILLKELEEFTGMGWEQEDDITLVLLRKTGH
jgi:serine phosphatase RsbU (regulator of sigma subunit)